MNLEDVVVQRYLKNATAVLSHHRRGGRDRRNRGHLTPGATLRGQEVCVGEDYLDVGEGVAPLRAVEKARTHPEVVISARSKEVRSARN